jgi:O-antigen/teichoic acid export membrane protein
MMEKTSKSAILWSIANGAGTRGITFIIFLLMGRNLGPELFGIVATGSALVILIDAIIEFKFSIKVINSIEIGINLLSSLFYFQVVLGCLFGICTWVFSSEISKAYGDERLAHALKWLSIVPIINSLGHIQESLLRKRLEFRYITIRNIFSNLISGTLGVLFLAYGYGIDSMLIMLMSNSLISTYFLWRLSRWRPTKPEWTVELKSIIKDSAYLSASNISSTIISQANVFIIGMTYGPSQAGLFAFANRIYDVVMRVTTFSISEAAFPILSQHLHNIEIYTKTYYQIMRKGALPTVFILIVGGSVSKYAVPFIFGVKWIEAIPYIEMLMYTGAIICFGALNDVNILANGKNKIIILSQVYSALLFGLQLLLMESYGPLLPVYVWVFKELSMFPVKSYISVKIMDERPISYIKLIGPSMVAAIITIVCAFENNGINYQNEIGEIVFDILKNVLVFLGVYVISNLILIKIKPIKNPNL